MIPPAASPRHDARPLLGLLAVLVLIAATLVLPTRAGATPGALAAGVGCAGVQLAAMAPEAAVPRPQRAARASLALQIEVAADVDAPADPALPRAEARAGRSRAAATAHYRDASESGRTPLARGSLLRPPRAA